MYVEPYENAPAGTVFLFVCKGDQAPSETNVFYEAAGVYEAGVICKLLQREFGSTDQDLCIRTREWRDVKQSDASAFAEAIYWIGVYNSPDVAVSDRRPLYDIFRRARLALKAREWEDLVPGPLTPPPLHSQVTDSYEIVARLAIRLERHRLLFLFSAQAWRSNPRSVHRMSELNEHVDRNEIQGWQAMTASIDEAGQFLWTHQKALELYGRTALDRYGQDFTSKPVARGHGATHNEQGFWVPCWILDPGASARLEDSSKAIKQACVSVAAIAHSAFTRQVVRAVLAAARPNRNSRWCEEEVVEWEYLRQLDQAMFRLQQAWSDLCQPAYVHRLPGPQAVHATANLLDLLVKVDVSLSSLATNLDSLAGRGRQVNDPARVVRLQRRLHEWIDPTIKLLGQAETAANGVGAHLVESVEDPLTWERDTRRAIRSLNDLLVRLIDSNGDEDEQALVDDALLVLCGQGQRLQEVYETLSVRTLGGEAVSLSKEIDLVLLARPFKLTKEARSTIARVAIGQCGEACLVNGVRKPPLTDGQYAVIAALVTAGEKGLTKDALEAIRASARRMLVQLQKDIDWREVILMPGKTNGRYRIRS